MNITDGLLGQLQGKSLGQISQQLGITPGQARAPAKAKATANTSVQASPDELGDVLRKEEVQITREDGVGGKLLGAVLDRNHDGKVDFSDLMAGLKGGRA